MTDLGLGIDVDWPDHEAEAAVRERLADAPDLGRLADLARWAAGVSARPVADRFERPSVIVFEGTPGPAVESLAASTGASLRPAEGLPADVAAALAAGAALADREADAGCDLLVAAAAGRGSAPAVAVSVLTNTESVKVMPRGAASTDPEAWMALAVEIRDGRRRCKPLRTEPRELLVAIGSPELAAVTGFVLQAAVRRTPVVLDGRGAAAGALVAYEAQPRGVRWWCAADAGPDPVHSITYTRLGQQPVLTLGTAAGDGVAGLLAVQVLRAAVLLGG